MKNFLSIFSKSSGVLRQPGDSFLARVTKTGRQVIKIRTGGGKIKRSAVRYPSTGTIVETIVKKIK